MKYKTELHAHTYPVSRCAEISVSETVETYIQNGFSTLVIANHYSPATFKDMENLTWQEKNEHFLSAYKEAVLLAKGRINVILAMEYRNYYTLNDYLVYGLDEDFIKKHSVSDEQNFLKMHLKEFSELAHNNNLLIFQAHPFRNGMTVINPDYLDGIEILNGHRRHDSRNDIASLWADKFNMLRCGGSDCHRIGDEATVAFVTNRKITTSRQLVNALKKEVTLEQTGDR